MDSKVPAFYDIIPEGNGWTVYNVRTLKAAKLKGERQVGLRMKDADNLVNTLNAMERSEPGSSFTCANGSY